MDHKEAIKILIDMLKSPKLTKEEKEAINTAIGVLGWTSLAKSRMEAIKNKKHKTR